MSDFIECQKYYVPCEFEIPHVRQPHQFILVGSHFRQKIAPVNIGELEVTSWQEKGFNSISQKEMQMHVQWIRDSINLLKELCEK